MGMCNKKAFQEEQLNTDTLFSFGITQDWLMLIAHSAY